MNHERTHNPVLRWMHDGIPMGSVAGVAVGLHPLLLMLAAFWCQQAIRPAAMYLDLDRFGFVIVDGVFAVALILAPYLGSLLLHELGHVATLRLLHLAPQRVVLLPLGGGTRTPGGERSPYAEALAAFGGPLVSAVLALVSTIICLTMPGDLYEGFFREQIRNFFSEMAYINWILFGFNMLVPVFPLGCARLVRAILSMRFESRKTTYDLALMGMLTVGLFVIVSLALHFLPTGSPYLGSSAFLLSILFAAAVHGGWESHAQMRHVQQSEVYSDPEFAKPLFDSLFPRKPAPRPVRGVTPANSTTTEEAQPSTETPVRHHRATEAPAENSYVPPRAPKPPSRPLSPREQLMRELDAAVREEDFLRAAQIRDRIRSLAAHESRTS